MRISKVTLRGWMCYRDESVLVLPAGPIAVVGEHVEDRERSNWSGKTALLEAIRWCIFGAHRKRTDDEVVNWHVDEAVVEVELLAATGQTVTVSRSKRRGSSVVLDFAGKQGAAAEQALRVALGCDVADYDATVAIRQGDVLGLASRTSSARRDVVGEWLGLGRWDALALRIGLRLKGSRTDVGYYEGVVAGIPEVDDEMRDAWVAEVKAAEAAAERAESAADVLRKAKDWIDLDDELKAHRVSALKARREIADVGDLEPPEDTTRLHVEHARARTRFNELAELVRGQGFDGTCPVSCEACPVADEVRAVAARRVDEVERAEAEATAAWAALEEATALSRVYHKLASERAEATGRYREIVARGKALAAKLADLPEPSPEVVEAGLVGVGVRLITQAQVAAEQRQRAADHRAKLERAEDDRGRRLVAQAALLEAREQVAKFELAMRAVSPDGVPARIAAREILTLEARANEVLDGVLGLRFGWDRVLSSSLAPSCPSCDVHYPSPKSPKRCPKCGTERPAKRRPDLELLVDDGRGPEEDVSVKSGAAQVLVAVAVRLAAATMLRERRDMAVGWAEVDEPFGPTDAPNREQLAATFLGMLARVGLEQAFVVSHDQALLDAFPTRVLVEAGPDGSKARVI